MRLIVSLLNFRPGRIGGTETYLRQLIPHLARVMPEGNCLGVLMHRDNASAIATPRSVEQLVVPLSERAVTRRRIAEAMTPWRDRLIEKVIAQFDPTVTLYPQQSIYPKYHHAAALLTVHDLQHLTRPEMIAPAERLFRRLTYGRALERASRIIAISQHVSAQLQALAGINAEKIDVVPHGYEPPQRATATSADHAPTPSPGMSVPDTFLYYPAATHPHKGHDALFGSLAAISPAERPALVLTGQQTKHWPRLRAMARRLGIADDVHALGFVSYELVQHLYRHCHSVVFPSRHEGFGIPVLEAISHGCRLITSDLPVFREIGVPDENRIDFDDPVQLAASLSRLPKPTQLTKTPTTWLDAARLTLASIERAAEM